MTYIRRRIGKLRKKPQIPVTIGHRMPEPRLITRKTYYGALHPGSRSVQRFREEIVPSLPRLIRRSHEMYLISKPSEIRLEINIYESID